jgi:uncharacterized protein (DUF1330 family)
MTVLAVFEVRSLPDADDHARACYAVYKVRVAPMIEAAGGRYLVRAATGVTLDGDASGDADRRWHVIEFPSAEAARSFWESEEYAAIVPLREGAVEVRAVLIR